VNNAFYRLPEKSTFEAWRERTPSGFVVAVKMSRYLTHVKRLSAPAEPVARFLDRVDGLGPKLGPVLLQLPPTLPADVSLLDGALARFPETVRVVVEPRHASWFSPPAADDVRKVLTAHNAALCWADRRGRPVTPLWRTADFGYLRMHEGTASPRPRYGRSALRTWLGRLREAYGSANTYVYFNNDHGAAAVHDAQTLIRMAAWQDRRHGHL
jgi:uncharacterized protein YecE (DUF72 family)